MAQLMTQARPYARAAHEWAKAHNVVEAWLDFLQKAVAFMAYAEVVDYLQSPKVTRAEVVSFFKEAIGNVSVEQENFLKLLAIDKQFNLLPDITTLFTRLHQNDDEIVAVNVIAAKALTAEAEQRLAQTLEQRLGKKVKLVSSVDATLIGGAVIRTQEWVLDGSVKGKLEQLKTTLVG